MRLRFFGTTLVDYDTNPTGAWSVRFVGWADWVDCRCFLSFVFLGVARRLELSPCNTNPTKSVGWSQRC